MNILEIIQKEALRSSSSVFEVDEDTWDDAGITIAGYTHLLKKEQLIQWAKAHNLDCVYDFDRRRFKFRVAG